MVKCYNTETGVWTRVADTNHDLCNTEAVVGHNGALYILDKYGGPMEVYEKFLDFNNSFKTNRVNRYEYLDKRSKKYSRTRIIRLTKTIISTYQYTNINLSPSYQK